MKSERTEKKKLKEEISVIRDLNEDNLRKIEAMEEEVNQMKNGHEAQVNGMRSHIETREQRIDDMEIQIIELKDKLLKQENNHQDSTRKKDRDIKVLNERLKSRYNELIDAKKDIIDAGNNLKKTLKALETSDKRADDAEKRYEELIRKIEAKVQDQSLVANSEKPGPEKVEEADPEDPTGESSQLQTTGGNLGDSEGEVTFTRPATPPPPPYPKGRIEEDGGRREEKVVMPQ